MSQSVGQYQKMPDIVDYEAPPMGEIFGQFKVIGMIAMAGRLHLHGKIQPHGDSRDDDDQNRRIDQRLAAGLANDLITFGEKSQAAILRIGLKWHIV